PLSGEVENDLFTVTRDGEGVAYLGYVAKRGAPSAEDFVRLGPGESRSARVELSALYDMSQPGTYAVQYRAAGPAMAPRIGKGTASTLLYVTLGGKGRPSPLAAARPAPLAASNSYVSCSNTQISDLEQARPAAANYVSSARQSLSGSAGARYT